MENENNNCQENCSVVNPADEMRPYILVTRVFPGCTCDKEPEGLKIYLDENGELNRETLSNFIMEGRAVCLDDHRTMVLNYRLRNNTMVAETISARSPEEYSAEDALRILSMKLENKVWEYLSFLHAAASVTDSKIKHEYAEKNENPVPIEDIKQLH